jgi:hypothetical protein
MIRVTYLVKSLHYNLLHLNNDFLDPEKIIICFSLITHIALHCKAESNN